MGLINPDGTVRWISMSVNQVLAAPPEHYIGRTIREIFAEDSQAEVNSALEAVRRGEVVSMRTRVVTNNGLPHWVRILIKPYVAADGDVDGFVSTFRVIDAEVAAEAAAHETRRLEQVAEARYRRLMASTSIATSIITVEGQFDVFNQAMCEFFGYDADTLRKMTWQEVTGAAYLDADQRKVDDVLAGRIEAYRMRKQYIHASGRPVWGDLSVSCLRDRGGEVEHLVAQIVDITLEVEAQQAVDELNARVKTELRSAASYVAELLPGDLEGPVQVSCWYRPSRQLGGDSFYYRWIDDDHFIAYLLDVSGHGIEPALLSTSVNNLLRSRSMPTAVLNSPERVLSELNERFQMDTQGGHFVTVWYGVYEASTRTLRYASAAHPPALALDVTPQGPSITELVTGGIPIGVFEEVAYSNGEYSVPPGGQILVYSDGAYEISLADGDFGTKEDFKATCLQIAATTGWTIDSLMDFQLSRTPDEQFDDDVSLFRMTIN